jgi:hypothetical protein
MSSVRHEPMKFETCRRAGAVDEDRRSTPLRPREYLSGPEPHLAPA